MRDQSKLLLTTLALAAAAPGTQLKASDMTAINAYMNQQD